MSGTVKTGADVLALLTDKYGIGSISKTEKESKEKNKHISFDRNIHFTFGEGDKQLQYTTRSKKEKEAATTSKYGQLKLFLAELIFLNLYYDPNIHKNAKIIYVGAALGTHIAPLARMFPMIEFHLYDPQPFNHEVLDPVKNIIIYEELFTDEDSKVWIEEKEKGSSIFLIVDIRNLKYGKVEHPSTNQAAFRKNEQYVWDDMLFQRKIFEDIKPTKALLKMRLPYYENFMTKDETLYNYLDGVIFRQQFASQTSTETRFAPHDADEDGVYPERVWNIRTYENVTNSHNKELREKALFVNPFSTNNKNIKFDDPIAENIGLYNDYDSTAATLIICDYLIKFGVSPSYDEFYTLAKQIFIEVGKSNIWNYNLRGIRLKENFIDEKGNVIEQEPKIRGKEDIENDPNIRD